MASFSQTIAQFMVDVGFLDVILPFMLVFTILFAILQKIKVFGTYNGEPKRNVNAMVSFVVAFFFIASLARVEVLTSIVQKLALILVIAIALMLVTGLWGKEVGFLKYSWTYVILFIILLVIFGTSLKWFTLDDLGIIGTWIFHPITIMALAFILILWLIIKEPSKKKAAKPSKPEVPKEPGKPAEKKDEEKGEKPEEPEGPQPELVQEVPQEELYGGDNRVVWKE